jgi:hypothetical protein
LRRQKRQRKPQRKKRKSKKSKKSFFQLKKLNLHVEKKLKRKSLKRRFTRFLWAKHGLGRLREGRPGL